MRPVFLDLDQVLRLHQDLIETYGGIGGLRDVGLLQSAVAAPMATFDNEFLHRDLIDMAAAYLFHLVQNHPFLDGNKRTGAASAIVFLLMNDVAITTDEDGLIYITMAVASGLNGIS